MEIVKWRAYYETGIGEMDDQHRKLIELINTMYRVMRDKEEESSVERVLQEMSDYADFHLASEETYLRNEGYTDFDQHLALHAYYRDNMRTLLKEYRHDKQTTARNVYLFLREWFMKHIVEEDKKYGAVLKNANYD